MIENQISKLSFLVILLLISCNFCLCWRKVLVKSNSNSKDLLNDDIQEINQLSSLQDHLETDLEEDKQLDGWSLVENPELGDYVEGDIITDEKDGGRRTFSKKDRIWFEGIVPVYIDTIILNDSRAFNVLKNSMRTIQSNTHNCIMFRPITDADIIKYPTLPYVHITGHEKSCSSAIGRPKKSNIAKIKLSINRCFKVPGTSMHELMHILGQVHEHMRPDRDKYITVRWKNIVPRYSHNFELQNAEEAEMFHYPYDYESITHYPKTAFSVNEHQIATIIPKEKDVKIGQRTYLSKIDIAKLFTAYKCERRQSDYTLEQLANFYKNETIMSATFDDVLDKRRSLDDPKASNVKAEKHKKHGKYGKRQINTPTPYKSNSKYSPPAQEILFLNYLYKKYQSEKNKRLVQLDLLIRRLVTIARTLSNDDHNKIKL